MKGNNVKLWLMGIAVAVLLAGGAYWIGASGARAQMGMQSTTAQTDPMERIAAALERIAAAMEKSGSMQGMGTMGSMQERMQQCQAMMEQMQKMMQGMQGMMGGPMAQPTPSAPSAQAAPPTEADLTRTSQAAGIAIAVTLMNPLLKPEESAGKLVFKIALDTHTVDLSQFDLTKVAMVRTSEGTGASEGFTWEPINESSHHRMGLLKVADTLNGTPLITKETQWLELELKEIGTPSRVFRWEGQSLTALVK